MYRGMGTSATESARGRFTFFLQQVAIRADSLVSFIVRRLLDSLTKKQGAKYDSPASRRDIAPFIEFHNLDVNEVLDPLPSFREFPHSLFVKLQVPDLFTSSQKRSTSSSTANSNPKFDPSMIRMILELSFHRLM